MGLVRPRRSFFLRSSKPRAAGHPGIPNIMGRDQAAYYKAWYEKNREAKLEKDRARYQANKAAESKKRKANYRANKTARLGACKAYYLKTRATRLKQKNAYNLKNKAAMSEKGKAYYLQHREEVLARSRAPRGRVTSVCYGARKRGLAVEIAREDLEEMVGKECFYCGEAPAEGASNGVDRVDNDKGYVPDNCVPCCSPCNRMKMALDPCTFLERACHVSAVHGGEGAACGEDAWGKDAKHCFGYLVRGAAQRALEVSITREDFNALRVQDCAYCLRPSPEREHHGIDRVDSSIGYVLDNCVAACGWCNVGKGVHTADEFVERCKRIAARAGVIRDFVERLPPIARCTMMMTPRAAGAKRGAKRGSSAPRQEAPKRARQASEAASDTEPDASGDEDGTDEANSEPEADSEPEAEAESDSESESESESDSEPEAESESESEAEEYECDDESEASGSEASGSEASESEASESEASESDG